MQPEQDSPKPSFDGGSPKAPENSPPSFQPSPNSEKVPTPEPDAVLLRRLASKTADEEAIEQLILSARRTGYAEALADVTTVLVEAARLDDAQAIIIMLAKRFDTLTKKGATLNA